MQITDPIADMLTRIRNAAAARHDSVDVPASKMKKSIAQILLDEGYIKNFQIVDDGTQGVRRPSPASSVFPSRACASMPAHRSSPRFSAASASQSSRLPRAS